jgi:predicted PurR-regulated permease PerM
MPSRRDKEETVKLSRDMEQTISTYLFTITLINMALALIIALAMSLVGMPNPPLWGAVAGILNFIPYFGPFVMTLVMVLAGLLSFESTGHALLPALIYLSVHATESNLITPAILGRRLTLSPVAIFISIMFWTWLWGMPGALLSVPLLMTFRIICDHVKPLAPVGEFLSG